MEKGTAGLGVSNMTRGLIYRPEIGCTSLHAVLWLELPENGDSSYMETHSIGSPDILILQCLAGYWGH